MLLGHHLPLWRNKAGIYQLLLEPYQKAEFDFYTDNGKKIQAACDLFEAAISDKQRQFFYGKVFVWAANTHAKYRGIDFKKGTNLQDFGKKLLIAIYDYYKKDIETYTADSEGKISFCFDTKVISFSKNDSNKRLQEAIDIWTVFFAEEYGEVFPIPDIEWRKNEPKKIEIIAR